MDNTQSGPGSISFTSVMYTNPEGTVFINGDKVEEGSHRFAIDTDTGFIIAQVLISDIWQPASLITGAATLWLLNVGLGAIGEHLITELPGMPSHFHAHNHFDGQTTIHDSMITDIYEFVVRDIFQPDNTGSFTGKLLSFVAPTTESALVKKFYFQTDTIAATKPVTICVWEGLTEDPEKKRFKQVYPASEFPSSQEISLLCKGHIQFDEGKNYLIKIESEADFSLKTNVTGTLPWVATDDSNFREDDMLQVRSYESRSNGIYIFVEGEDWTIQNKKIYICNTTGTQTGTFASNSDKWETIGSSHITYNEVANYASLPDPSEHASEIYIVLASTGFDWNRRKGLYHSDGIAWTRLSNVNYEVTDAEAFFRDDIDTSKIAKFELSEISTGTTRTYTFPDISGRILVDGMTDDVGLNGNINLNNIGKIVNLVDPTLDQDGATKNYVDSHSTNGVWTRTGTIISPTNMGDDVSLNGSLTLNPLTKGSLLFTGAGGLISEDNSNLFWDDTNKRLGIGKNTPDFPLDVVGNVLVTGDAVIIRNSSTTRVGIDIEQNGAGDAAIFITDGNASVQFGIDQSDGSKFKISGLSGDFIIDPLDNSVNLTDGNITVDTGNINAYGINGDNSNFIAGLDAGSNLTTGHNLVLIGQNAGSALTTEEDSVIVGRFAANNAYGSNAVVLGFGAADGSANINDGVFIGYCAGYGNTEPNKLFIANNATTSLIEGDFVNKWVKIDGREHIEVTESSGLWGAEGTLMLQNTSALDGSWTGIQNNALNGISAGISFLNLDYANNYGSISFAARSATGWKNNILSLSYDIAYFNSNVGIGIADPKAQLDVAGGNVDSLGLQLRSGEGSTGGGDSSQILLSYNGASHDSGGYTHSIRTRHNGLVDGENAIDFWLWNTSTFDENTIGDELVMTLTGEGNVGIGISTPASKVHIFEDTVNTGSAAGLTIENDGTGDAALHFALTSHRSWMVGVDHSDSYKFKIARGIDFDSYPYFTIDDNTGNIGLGTTVPLTNLHIATRGATSGLGVTPDNRGMAITGHDSGSCRLYFENTGATLGEKVFVLNNGDGILKFRSYNDAASAGGTDNILAMEHSGNVGIGTNIIDARLHINQPDFDAWGLVIEGGGFRHDSDKTTNDAWQLFAPDITSANAFHIDGDGLTTGGLLRVASSATGTQSRSLVRLENIWTTSTGTTVLNIKQNANGSAMYIDANGITDGAAAHIYVPNLSTGFGLIVSGGSGAGAYNIARFEADTTASGDGVVMYLNHRGGGQSLKSVSDSLTKIVNEFTADSLTTGSIAHFYSNSSNVAARNLVEIHNDHASAIGTACLRIENDSSGLAISTDGSIKLDNGSVMLDTGSLEVSLGDIIMPAGNLIMTGDIRITGTIDVTTENINMQGGDILVNGGKLHFSGGQPEFIVPRLTQTGIDVLTPQGGQIVFNTTFNVHQGWDGSSWRNFY